MNRIISLNVHLIPDNIKKNVLVNPIYPIGVLRMNIAKTFDIPVRSFEIRDKTNRIIDTDLDETSFNDYGIQKNMAAFRI